MEQSTQNHKSAIILTLQIRFEQDVVLARQRARQIAGLLGFAAQDQTRIATATSEIARNALNYAGGGKVEFSVQDAAAPQRFLIHIQDEGPGIADLPGLLEGRYASKTGLGLGIVGARRLMDYFYIESTRGAGTTVWLGKTLPPRAAVVIAPDLAQIADELARHPSASPLEEIQQQNQELIRTLEELRQRQEQLITLNRELDDTNRGVVALYAELEEKAENLRRADGLKSRFLSNMSHEFRTPLNSIQSLSQILLERIDGDLTSEQERQVTFVYQAAQDLSELVNDLLDLAKIEAGKIVVRPTEFQVADLFSALRGMLKPLLVNPSIALVFEDPVGIPTFHTDQGKVSQILRNLISNALKFTERGEVRVSSALEPGGNVVRFCVADTGIGIAPEDQERIFQEFAQVDSPIQRRVKGTGLGLPLSKRLAQLLGGDLWLTESQPEIGSTFSAVIPRVYAGPTEFLEPQISQPFDPTRFSVLVIEDDPEAILMYEEFLKGSGFQVIPAGTLKEARKTLQRIRPFAIVLDILLPGEDAWEFLTEMKGNQATRNIPLLVATVVKEPDKGLALGADDYVVKPVEREWLLGKLRALASRGPLEKVLIVDDEEVSRYLLKGLLAETRYAVIEATNGTEGLRRAREEHPHAILLDLMMPGMSGFEVLSRLKANPATRHIPVIIVTAKKLEEEERALLDRDALAILSKETQSREEAIAQIREALIAARR